MEESYSGFQGQSGELEKKKMMGRGRSLSKRRGLVKPYPSLVEKKS